MSTNSLILVLASVRASVHAKYGIDPTALIEGADAYNASAYPPGYTGEGARCIANYKAAGAPRFAAVSGLTTTLSLTLQVLLQIGFNHPHQLDLQIQFQILAAILVGVFVGYACLTLRRCALSWDGADDGDADRSVAASPQMMEPQTSYRCFDDARTSATVSSASRAGS